MSDMNCHGPGFFPGHHHTPFEAIEHLGHKVKVLGSLVSEGETKLAAADTRAVNAEKMLQNNIDNESTRAIGAENVLKSSIETQNNSLQALINGEKDRAIIAETGLENKHDGDVDNLNNRIELETNRAISAENGLRASIETEVLRATGSETTLNGALLTERNRAIGAEADLADSINRETTRATSAEAGLEGLITSETTRATGAESQLQTNIVNEAVTARGAEAELATRITESNTRAVTRENQLQDEIDREISRATSAESHLNGAIVTETNRAMTNETMINSKLTDEISRSTNMDDYLTQRIANVESSIPVQQSAFSATGESLTIDMIEADIVFRYVSSGSFSMRNKTGEVISYSLIGTYQQGTDATQQVFSNEKNLVVGTSSISQDEVTIGASVRCRYDIVIHTSTDKIYIIKLTKFYNSVFMSVTMYGQIKPALAMMSIPEPDIALNDFVLENLPTSIPKGMGNTFQCPITFTPDNATNKKIALKNSTKCTVIVNEGTDGKWLVSGVSQQMSVGTISFVLISENGIEKSFTINVV